MNFDIQIYNRIFVYLWPKGEYGARPFLCRRVISLPSHCAQMSAWLYRAYRFTQRQRSKAAFYHKTVAPGLGVELHAVLPGLAFRTPSLKRRKQKQKQGRGNKHTVEPHRSCGRGMASVRRGFLPVSCWVWVVN